MSSDCDGKWIAGWVGARAFKCKGFVVLSLLFFGFFFLGICDDLAVCIKEKPRNHLDMRNRLNSKGQREGKVIDYRYCFNISLSAAAGGKRKMSKLDQFCE